MGFLIAVSAKVVLRVTGVKGRMVCLSVHLYFYQQMLPYVNDLALAH